MRDDSFKAWMIRQGNMGSGPIADALSRCRRVEQGFNTDLDTEYLRDHGHELIEKLCYSADDERQKKPVPSGLNFLPGANLRKGMASLKAAVKKYFEFYERSN